MRNLIPDYTIDSARHEAGHAAAAILLGTPPKRISVHMKRLAGGGLDLGSTEQDVTDGVDYAAQVVIVLAGGLAAGESHWPPAWPPSAKSLRQDGRVLASLIDCLDADEAGWSRLVKRAQDLVGSDNFQRLADFLTAELVHRKSLDLTEITEAIDPALIGAHNTEGAMQHKQLQATTTETDQEQGTFTALVSAWEADREGDVIARHAFDRTIEAWRRSGKMMPLLDEHTPEVVGSIDPFSMRTTDAGLIVAGEVDRSTDEGQRVWRSIKNNTAGFSIGYMAEDDRLRPDGGHDLLAIDLFEISWTPRPMNASTRALSWKSAELPYCPPELIGTAWDPLMADGSPVQAKVHAPNGKAMRPLPTQIAEFEVE